MDRLWERGRPTLVREMVEDLREDRALAYTTVMTVMDNLHRKGWLRRERDGRAWRYEPTGSPARPPAAPGVAAARPGRPGLAHRAHRLPVRLHRRADERRAGHQRGPANGARAF